MSELPDELEGEITRILQGWRRTPPAGWTDEKAAEEARLWLEASEAGVARGDAGYDRDAGRTVAAAIWAAWLRYRDETAL